MSILEYSSAFFKTISYPILPKFIQKNIQNKRLKSLLKYAKKHSEYYKDLIPDDLDFQKIPPIDKKGFLANFDKIVTDKQVTLSGALDVIKTNDVSEGARLAGKYSVTKTSGSTGNPTVVIMDSNFQNISSVSGFFRFMHCRVPIVMVGESGGFGIEAATIKQNMKKAKFVSSIVKMIDVEAMNIDEIIAKLKNAGPSTVVGYTGVMTILANKLINNNVRLKEKQIFLSGEQCTKFDKEIIGKAFDCPSIRVLYGCTEAGGIAWECEYGHLHILSDCVHIEPVDEHNNPIGYDKLSDKILLTNLMNRVQPIIRYEVTDKIVLHQGCPCGCNDDWLEINGRSNDNITFEKDGEKITIPSISLLIAVSTINKDGLQYFKNYQIAIQKTGHLCVTLDYVQNANRSEVNEKLTECLDKFFGKYGVGKLTYEFEEGEMKKTQRGKRKRVYMVD